jgi:hypothetical protein
MMQAIEDKSFFLRLVADISFKTVPTNCMRLLFWKSTGNKKNFGRNIIMRKSSLHKKVCAVFF